MYMKIVYISGVKFGFELLEEILKNNFQISAVFSYEDSKSSIYSDYVSFDKLCKKYNIKHVKVKNINDKENVELIKSISPDLILVMGWSQLIKNKIIDIPNLGLIGSHPTELPKYRGRAPIPWSIIKGLKESALTFFYIEDGVDDGDIFAQQKFLIKPNDDATSLYNKIINLGKQMIIDNLRLLENKKSIRIKQDESKFIELWKKRTPDDGLINWSKSSQEIQSLIRASTHPYPGAFTFFKKSKMIIWKADFLENDIYEPGKILDVTNNGVIIGTGNGIVTLHIIELPNDISKHALTIFSKNDIGLYLSSKN